MGVKTTRTPHIPLSTTRKSRENQEIIQDNIEGVCPCVQPQGRFGIARAPQYRRKKRPSFPLHIIDRLAGHMVL